MSAPLNPTPVMSPTSRFPVTTVTTGRLVWGAAKSSVEEPWIVKFGSPAKASPSAATSVAPPFREKLLESFGST